MSGGSCMVLCAGLGTRLRPLTEELPKPLVPVGDGSILAHALLSLARAGFQRAVINTHHLPGAFAHLERELPLPITRVHEPTLRGTAGGIAGARSFLSPCPVVVYNGDILVREPPISALMARAGGGLALAVAPRRCGEGTVGIDAHGRIARLRGERFGEERVGGDYVGVAAIGARCLAELPDNGCLIGDWALPELRAGRSIAVVSAELSWTDAGDLQSYLSANLSWLDTQGQTSWVGRGATVTPAVTLERCVIGAGAHVSGAGALVRVVAWPGAHVQGPLHDAVVTASGRVVPIA